MRHVEGATGINNRIVFRNFPSMSLYSSLRPEESSLCATLRIFDHNQRKKQKRRQQKESLKIKNTGKTKKKTASFHKKFKLSVWEQEVQSSSLCTPTKTAVFHENSGFLQLLEEFIRTGVLVKILFFVDSAEFEVH